MRTLKRRRKESKTDYSKRLKLLKSGLPRIVFRKTNKYLIAQYITSEETKDKVKIGLTSKILTKYGWPEDFKGSLKSTPAAYLIGFLIGKDIIKNKKQTPIADFGMLRVLPKSKIYAFLKGLIDSGVKIKHKEENFPKEERLIGKNLKKDFSEIFKKIKINIEKK